ncbi:MAG: class I SAM-dependent methyltransferase [Ktedonobacteraceae bacterium]
MASDSTNQQGHYFIDAESAAEMARLTSQDRFLTEAMGGLFSERSDIASMQSILDLGCGPGQWILDVAFTYPDITAIGTDISELMVNYAQARARSQGLDNASFEVMDLTKPLVYADNSFDLVNGRLIAFLTPQQWTDLLGECVRIVQPGGVIRLTENDVITTNPATDQMFNLFYQAITRAGQSFSPTGRVLGITSRLNHLLQKAGCINIQRKAHALDFSAGTPSHETFCQVTSMFFSLMQPFLIHTGVTTQEEFERLHNQMEIEMHSEDFCAVMFLLTVWGNKPQAD